MFKNIFKIFILADFILHWSVNHGSC